MFGDYSEEYNYGIEKANGIEYLYAWLDIHPNVRPVAVYQPNIEKVG